MTDITQTGRCDVCQFRNLSVSPFNCLKHFYCQPCLKHAKFMQEMKNDYTCKICQRQVRQRREGQRYGTAQIEEILRDNSGSEYTDGFRNVAFTTTGCRVITWDDDDKEDSDSLSGNNDEWEKLLERLINDKPRVRSVAATEKSSSESEKSVSEQSSKSSPETSNEDEFTFDLPLVPKNSLLAKLSHQRMRPPFSLAKRWGDDLFMNGPAVAPSPIQTHYGDARSTESRSDIDQWSISGKTDCDLDNDSASEKPSLNDGRMSRSDFQDEEIERCTSPCKGRRHGHEGHFSPFSQLTEDDYTMEKYLDPVEGPAFEDDSFWDDPGGHVESSMGHVPGLTRTDAFWDSA